MTAPDATAPLPGVSTAAVPSSLSAVLPAYNEVAVIADVVMRTHAALERSGVGDVEVIVVDDGSRDGTAAAVRDLNLPGVRVVEHEHNSGYGAALRSGFAAARGEAVWLLDADGQFDPADLGLLLERWRPGRLVAGYRARREDPMMRRLNHTVFFALVRVLMGRTARDVNCAFKLFPRELSTELRSQGAMISTELLLAAQARGVAVVEVAVPHHPRRAGRPTGADPRVVARAFAELWRMRRERGSDARGAR